MAQANVLAARIHASSMAVDACTTAMKIGGGIAYARGKNKYRKTFKRFSGCCCYEPSTDVSQLGFQTFNKSRNNLRRKNAKNNSCRFKLLMTRK